MISIVYRLSIIVQKNMNKIGNAEIRPIIRVSSGQDFLFFDIFRESMDYKLSISHSPCPLG